MRISIMATTALSVALLAMPGQAQQQATNAQPQVAEQCLSDLRAFDAEARQEGYGLIGPGPAGIRPYGAVEPRATPPAAGTGRMTTGWRGYGAGGPRRDLQVLYQAAYVFAQQGDEEACQMVLRETRQMFEERTARLRQAGVSPDEIRTWRADELAAARPVEQIGPVHVERIIGADVRNLQDEDLGDIDDVVLDPESGEISHVLVSHGGFLGMGQDHVAVPWNALNAAPNMDTFVLHASEAAIEQAPKVDPDAFANPETYGREREPIDTYWNEKLQQRQ